MMDSASSSQFSFAFLLAILFHLLLLFLLILSLNFESDVATKNTITAMQASILEWQPASEETNQNAEESAKKLSYVEKKRLARIQKQALRLEQAEKKKIYADAAQKLVWENILAKKYAQEITIIERKVKTFWQRPIATKGLSCIIQVELFASGLLKKAAVIKSSGNKPFDDSAKEAVYKAKQFQLPDDDAVRQKMLAGFFVHLADE